MDQTPDFNLRVTHRDEKTGAVTHSDPYVLRVIGTKGEDGKLDGGKMYMFERPVNSGNLWNSRGTPVGRWVNGKWDEKAAHVAFTPPETQDQKLAKELISKDNRVSELERELAAIKAEAEAKQTKAPAKKDQGA
jgi:hypothetical protein